MSNTIGNSNYIIKFIDNDTIMIVDILSPDTPSCGIISIYEDLVSDGTILYITTKERLLRGDLTVIKRESSL